MMKISAPDLIFAGSSPSSYKALAEIAMPRVADAPGHLQQPDRGSESHDRNWRSSVELDGIGVRAERAGAADDLPHEDLLVGEQHADAFYSAIRFAVIIGQCFSLLPVSVRPGTVPRFRYISARSVYFALVTFGLLLNAALTIVDSLKTQRVSTIAETSRWMFYISATSVSVMFCFLAVRWRHLCLCFLRVELLMSSDGHPPRLGLRLRVITIAVLSLALVEYLLSQYAHIVPKSNAGSLTSREFFSIWYAGYPYMLLLAPYNPFLLAVTQFLNVTATFMWNYNDLIIMLISVALSQRFKLLNHRLHRTPKKEKTFAFWREAREKYNAMSVLTREVDQLIGVQILVSFMNNLYFICVQLLHSVKPDENASPVKSVYFLFSFGLLIVRTAFVSLFAASINDESRNVKKELYSVSSFNYCQEVERFIIQATTDEVALTGLSFFSVTRSFLLTVVGTIATYEIVLVQFNGNKKTV